MELQISRKELGELVRKDLDSDGRGDGGSSVGRAKKEHLPGSWGAQSFELEWTVLECSVMGYLKYRLGIGISNCDSVAVYTTFSCRLCNPLFSETCSGFLMSLGLLLGWVYWAKAGAVVVSSP